VFDSDRPLALPALCDFDLSIEDVQNTATTLSPATYFYMPEDKSATKAVDVYSLGVSIVVVLYVHDMAQSCCRRKQSCVPFFTFTFARNFAFQQTLSPPWPSITPTLLPRPSLIIHRTVETACEIITTTTTNINISRSSHAPPPPPSHSARLLPEEY
jgi:serine/threonine protein kinase